MTGALRLGTTEGQARAEILIGTVIRDRLVACGRSAVRGRKRQGLDGGEDRRGRLPQIDGSRALIGHWRRGGRFGGSA
jgi:hypothetical protein